MKSRFRAIALVASLGCAVLCCNAHNEHRHITAEKALFIADSLQDSRQHQSAVDFVEAYLDDLGELRDSTVSIPLALLLMRLSDCYYVLERYQEADSAILGADAILAAADDTDSLRAFAMLTRGGLQWYLGNDQLAEQLHLDALSMLRVRFGETHPVVQYTWDEVLIHYVVVGDWRAYISFAEKFLQFRLDLYGPCDSLALERADVLALAYREVGDRTRERQTLELILESSRCSDVVYPKFIMKITGQLGLALTEEGDSERAVRLLRRSLNAAELHYQPESESLLVPLTRLGNVLAEYGEMDACDSIYRRVVPLAVSTLGRKHVETLEYRRIQGNILMNLRRVDEAASVLARALQDAEEVFTADSAQLIDYLFEYGASLGLQGDPEDAAPFIQRAVNLGNCCAETDSLKALARTAQAWLDNARVTKRRVDSLELNTDSVEAFKQD